MPNYYNADGFYDAPPITDGINSLFRFNNFTFHMLSAIGAAAFYAGTRRFGKPVFNSRLFHLLKTPSTESVDSGEAMAMKTGGELRLKSPIVTTFDGKPVSWIRWKTRTHTTFVSTGFGAVIDGTYDPTDSNAMDKVSSVFAWLVDATSDGSAYWLVAQHRPKMDGAQAWKSLCDWYDGENIKVQMASAFRNRIQGSVLIPGISASEFINQFMTSYNQLAELEDHAMNQAQAKDVFLENMCDPKYSTVKEQLALNLDQRDLMELVSETHKHELRLEQRKTNQLRVRRQNQVIDLDSTDRPAKRMRRAISLPTAKLPSSLNPNLEGFLYVDTALWNKLDKDSKSFITSYNRAHRHNESLPNAPTGVSIGNPCDDGRGNSDVGPRGKSATRVRRARSIEHETVDNQSIPPECTRKVLFHLNDDVNPRPARRIKLTQYRYVDDDSSLDFDEDYSIDGLPVETVKIKKEPMSPNHLPPRIVNDKVEHIPHFFHDDVYPHDMESINSNADTDVTSTNGDIKVYESHNNTSYDSEPDSEYSTKEYRADFEHGYVDMNKFNGKFARYCFLSSPRRYNTRRTRRTNFQQEHRFVVDTGAGKRPTITEAAWIIVGGEPGLTARLSPYQSNEIHEHRVVSAVTKAKIANLPNPVLLKVNYATWISNEHDPNEKESLLSTWDISEHGVTVNGIHPKNTKCGLTVDNTYMEFDHDDESIFFSISKPTKEEIDTYEIYELNSPLPTIKSRKRRVKETEWESQFKQIPMGELRKRLAYIPEESINKTLANTTQYYLQVTEENQSNPQQHFRKRFKAIPDRRQHESVATDFVYFSKKSSQGHIGGQFFSGVKSKRWEFYPLQKENQNSQALLDYIRKLGPPHEIISDNAKSEVGNAWTNIMRDHMIKSRTSEPHNQHQNPSEAEWGRLGNMIKNVLRQSRAPVELCNWTAMYCCQINNHVSRRSLKYKTPMEISNGHTPDISMFRFHFYEPLWYFDPKIKLPRSNLLKCRYLGLAESCGDAMTYYVLTEPDSAKTRRQVLMRSVIKTRRKNIGQHGEHVNNNPDMESFTLSLSESLAITGQEEPCTSNEVPLLVSGEKISDGKPTTEETNKQSEEHNNDPVPETLEAQDEQLPLELNSTNDAESHQAIVEYINEDLDGNCEFRKILNHAWTDGTLVMKAQYTDAEHGTFEIDTPFKKLKIDEPLACAKYIREYIPEERRGDRPLNDWADRTCRQHTSITRRMITINPKWNSTKETNNSKMARSILQSKLQTMKIRRNGPSRNQRWIERKNKEKFGIRIPNTIAEALRFDKEAGNTKWYDAIKKEMDNLNRLKVFKYHASDKEFPKEEGWQKASLRMIFDIKNEDQRYKARLVIGGHRVDSSDYNTYSSQVDNLSVLLLFLMAKHGDLSIMTCDISNAFPTAPNSEKVWAVAGDEFDDKKGCRVEVQRALYGLAGSARAFADFLADTLIRIGFQPSRADPDLWIKENEEGYDYIATHVDDVIVASKNPQQYISLIEQEYALRNIEVDPSYYLGARLTKRPDGKILMNMDEYCKEIIRKYENKHDITLKKENLPIPAESHPEMDTSDILNPEEHKEYQHIIGVGQWLVIRGRIDITYAISSLSRFATCPRKGHLTLARKILGYLKKYPKKGILIDPTPPIIQENPQTPREKFEEFGHQYQYFEEELDPKFPKPKVKELDITIFCDADHAHDLVTGRSITGIIAFVGSTPVYWKSTRQTSVQTSTFGSEFTALKKAVETAVTIRYYLRSMGVQISKATKIFVDNKSVFLNAANPASSLNKKAIALAYHSVREHQAGKVIDIRHIRSQDNYADCLTKSLNSTVLKNLLFEFMTK